jgi:hypothetical protein
MREAILGAMMRAEVIVICESVVRGRRQERGLGKRTV